VTKQSINGTLEIDHKRGIIYFHSLNGTTCLRICSLPIPIPNFTIKRDMLDITHMYGCTWKETIPNPKEKDN